jgi:hypothetical protein
MKEVLQIASGRSPDSLETGAPTAAIQNAACFFVQAALLYPGADHYSLLGLQRQANAAALKDRYRLMMRLLHPDFSSSLAKAAWPADAATRVNRAYEVLASPVQRRQYDASLDDSRAPSPPRPEVRTAIVKVAPPTSVAQDRRRGLKGLAALFGAAGAVVLLAILFVDASDKETLVQRSEAAPKSTTVALNILPVAASAPSAIPLLDVMSPASISSPPVAVAPRPVIQQPPTTTIAPAVEIVPARPTPAVTPVIVETLMSPATPPPPARPVALVAPEALPTPRAPPNPGVTLAEVHPLLSRLLQQIETGSGDRMLGMLDRNARGAPDAQALLQYFNSLADGSRPVKLSNVQFKAVPREGYLSVTGHVRLHVGQQSSASAGTDFALQADFVSRDGTVVMTRLARAVDN